MTSNKPVVSIIIAAHEDAENLGVCVASAANQTLEDIEILIVDDCSDDDSFEVAQGLASKDTRIQVHRTASNSGGAGAPRNIGMREASAEWLTFLDSDDILEPHAVESMLATARADDADVVCGRTQRLHLEDGRVAWWRAKLYTERRKLSSIDEYVDLVTDTNSTAKLYRREFLRAHDLRFLEGVHYEDLVFSAQVYSADSRLSVITDHVYTWKVYPVDVRRSITNRRDEQTNLEHRLEAIERVYGVVAAPSKARLRERYQQKFLEHDAWLYLKGLVDAPRAHAEYVLGRLEPACRRIPGLVYDRLPVRTRLLYGVVLCGSVDGVLELVPSLDGALTLEGTTVTSGGRVHWRPTNRLSREPQQGTLEESLLDLTGDEILATPFSEVKYGHRVTGIELAEPDCAVVRGFTADPLERVIPGSASHRVTAIAELRETGEQFEFPVQMRDAGDQRFEWECRVSVPAHLPYVRPLRFDMRLEIARDNAANASPLLYALGSNAPRLAPHRSSARSLLGQRFAFRSTRAGRLSLKLTQPRGLRGRLDEALHSAFGSARRWFSA